MRDRFEPTFADSRFWKALASKKAVQAHVSGAVASAYKVEQIPLTVLIDSEGRIRKVFRGVHSITELTKAIEAIGLPSSPSSSGQ